MYPTRFGYCSPDTIDEAVSLLERFEDSRLVAGGQSLIPLMKLRLATPKYVIDISKLNSLAHITDVGDSGVRIGALTRHRTIEKSKLLRDKYPLISDTASSIGDQQVRNLGTIGGSLAHADPAGDWAPALIALDAKIVAYGKTGSRSLDAKKFFLDSFKTALRHEEVITEVRVSSWGKNASGSYVKLERKAGDFATVSVAVQLRLGANKLCERAGIALGAVGATALSATKASEFLVGKMLTEANIEEASSLAARESNPSADLRGSEDFKRAMIKAYSKRAISRALARSESPGPYV